MTGATINLFDPGFRADPYPALARLRAADPVHQDRNGIWIITRHADVETLQRDPRLGRDYRRWRDYAAMRPFLADSLLEESVERWFFYRDPPDHTRLRRLAMRAFAPEAVKAVRAVVVSQVDALLTSLADQEEIEFVTAFAQPLPLLVISAIIGLPASDRLQLQTWADALTAVLEPARLVDAMPAANAANMEFYSYLRSHLRTRRRESPDDLMTWLSAQAQDDRLDERELLGMLVLLVVAGYETTSNLIGNGMLALLRHPEELARLRSDPSLGAAAIEEMLRYAPPAMLHGRVALQEIDVCGRTIRAGDLVFCMLAAANRDPMVFKDPDVFKIGRTPNPHVSFGGGGRYCVGAPLARLEGRVALNRILAAWREIEVDTEAVRWRDRVNLRGVEQLVIRVCH